MQSDDAIIQDPSFHSIADSCTDCRPNQLADHHADHRTDHCTDHRTDHRADHRAVRPTHVNKWLLRSGLRLPQTVLDVLQW
jgi:hypothetical protein